MKLNWNSLTKEERRKYMQIQTSPSGGCGRSGYKADDCGECGVCGRLTLGGGLCYSCYVTWKELDDKLRRQGQRDELA